MFEVNNGTANINGAQGKYDEKTVTNPSVRYGRNAVDNYYSFIEKPVADAPIASPDIDFSKGPTEENLSKLDEYLKENEKYLQSLPPLEYEYRYMPNMVKGNIDKNAVLGAAYEELGKKESVSVEDLDNNFLPDDSFTSKPLDVNNDGKIDVGEYGASILAADMLSKSDEPNPDNIDGTINSKGFSAVLAYSKKSNAEAAAKLYSNIYNQYQLGEAVKEFKPEA